MAVFPPPIFPEPITLKGCAAEAPYDQRIGFIRRVAANSSLSALVFAGMTFAWSRPPLISALMDLHWSSVYFAAFVSLLVLIAARRVSTPMQVVLAALFFVCWSAFFAVVGLSLRDAFSGFVYGGATLYVGLALGFGAYALLCGRDYTHVGSFVLTSLFIVAVWGVCWALFHPSAVEAVSLLVGTICANFYWHYDLAMILRRRRLSEPFSAIVDLYRDMLNFISYPVRVYMYQRERPKVQLRW